MPPDGKPRTAAGFSLKGVLVGGLVNTACNFAYSFVASFTLALGPWARGVPDDRMREYMGGLVFLSCGLIAGTACALLGGFVAARIAKARELLNAAASAVPNMILVLVFLLYSKNEMPIPTWYTIASYAAVIPAAILGGHLGRRRKRTIAAVMAPSSPRLGLPGA